MLLLKKTILLMIVCLTVVSHAAPRVSTYTKNKLQKELPVLALAVGDPVVIRTFKKEARLELWMKPANQEEYLLFRTYPICYHSGGLGPKLRVGDKVTPEGFYEITPQRLQPNSRFHLSMNIGFPNEYDRYHGRTGSLLMIHGACDSVGCFAMSNGQIEEIYFLVEQALKQGQPSIQVHAYPFHLNNENIVAHSKSKWIDFWNQLKPGYDIFNQHPLPLRISVNSNGNYDVHPSL